MSGDPNDFIQKVNAFSRIPNVQINDDLTMATASESFLNPPGADGLITSGKTIVKKVEITTEEKLFDVTYRN